MSHVNVYSITYRPAELLLTLDEYYKKIEHKSIEKYYIGSETADEASDSINHYQCYVQSSQSCTNLRKRIKKALEIENVHALKVEKHNDPEYLLGYCQKEEKAFLTNITKEELKKAVKYYSSKKDVIESLSNERVASMTANDIYEQILGEHLKNGETTYVHAYFVEFYRKFYKQIKFSVLSKLNRGAMKYYINMLISDNELINELE